MYATPTNVFRQRFIQHDKRRLNGHFFAVYFLYITSTFAGDLRDLMHLKLLFLFANKEGIFHRKQSYIKLDLLPLASVICILYNLFLSNILYTVNSQYLKLNWLEFLIRAKFRINRQLFNC